MIYMSALLENYKEEPQEHLQDAKAVEYSLQEKQQ